MGIFRDLSPTISTIIAKFGFSIGRFFEKYSEPIAKVYGLPFIPTSSASKKTISIPIGGLFFEKMRSSDMSMGYGISGGHQKLNYSLDVYLTYFFELRGRESERAGQKFKKIYFQLKLSMSDIN